MTTPSTSTWDQEPADIPAEFGGDAGPEEAPPEKKAPEKPAPDIKALEARTRSLGLAADKARAAYEVLSDEAELDDYYPVEQSHFKAEIQKFKAIRAQAKALGKGGRGRGPALAQERSYRDLLAKSKEQERKLRSGKYRWDPTEGLVGVEPVAAAEEVAPTQEAAPVAPPPDALPPSAGRRASVEGVADAIKSQYAGIETEAPSDAEELRAYDVGGDESAWYERLWESKGRMARQGIAPFLWETLKAPPTQTQRALEGPVDEPPYLGMLGGLSMDVEPYLGVLGFEIEPERGDGPVAKVFETHHEEADPGRISGQTLDNVRQLEPQMQAKLYMALVQKLKKGEKSTRLAAAAFSGTELELLDRQKRMEEGTKRGTPEAAAFLELAATDVSELRVKNNQQYMDFFKAEQTTESDRRAFVDVSNALTQIYAESPEGWDEIVETQKGFDFRITASHPHVGLVLSLIPRSDVGPARYMNMARNPRLAAEKLPEAYQRLGVALQSASPTQVAGLMEAVGTLMDKEEERARRLTGALKMERKRLDMEGSYIEDPSPRSYHGDYTMGQKLVRSAFEGDDPPALGPWGPVPGSWGTGEPTLPFQAGWGGGQRGPGAGRGWKESFGVEFIKRRQSAAYRDLRRLGVARALLHTLAMAQ